MPAATLLTDTVVFETPYGVDRIPLKMACKRYRTTGASERGGLTLIFAHANGSHKELWEPTISALLLPVDQSPSVKQPAIREAWAFDAPDHGDSAVANRTVLENSKDGVPPGEWGTMIHAFVQAHLSSHKIVLVGHSMGSIAIVCAMMCYPYDQGIPYKATVIVDPPMHDRELFNAHRKARTGQIGAVMKGVSMQRSNFDSKEAAYQWLSSHMPWKVWDERIRRIHVNEGFRLIDEGNPYGPVAAKCLKQHEVSKFGHWEVMFGNVDYITKTSATFPYHFIYGAVNDILPRWVQDNAVDPALGRKVVSVARVEGAGHLVVQQQPDGFTDALRDILNTVPEAGGRDQSRL